MYKICFNCGLKHQTTMSKRQRLCHSCFVDMFKSLVNEVIPAVYEFNDVQLRAVMNASKRLNIATITSRYSRDRYVKKLQERVKVQ